MKIISLPNRYFVGQEPHPIPYLSRQSSMDLHSFLTFKKLFTEEECVKIDRAFEGETIPKGTLIQQANRYSRRVLFIESGLLRTYYVKEGKDITHFFFDENYLIAPVNSILYHTTERYQWEAIEECHVKIRRIKEFCTAVIRTAYISSGQRPEVHLMHSMRCK
ncbi:MAG: hypothetical protein AAGI38_22220 [Bacteroidota bacterium]